MDQAKVLIIEDSRELAEILRRALSEDGFLADVALTGTEGLRKLQQNWDLVILDLMLPDIEGEAIQDFIAKKPTAPRVLVLTAKSDLTHRVSLFEKGCDDFLGKPFAVAELLGRVKALLRRTNKVSWEAIEFEGVQLNPADYSVTFDGYKRSLTPKEFSLCRALLSEPGMAISRKDLLQSVWGLVDESRLNLVEVHLANLRRKLEQIGLGPWLQTVRASGIRFQRPDIHES